MPARPRAQEQQETVAPNNRSAINTNLVMAGATLAVLPPLLIFALLQRFFVRTIASAGLTG